MIVFLWYKYPEKHQNGIAVLKTSNVPAGEYGIKIRYEINIHHKNTSAAHHTFILKTGETQSLDEILQRKNTELLNTIIWETWNLHWLKIQMVKNG